MNLVKEFYSLIIFFLLERDRAYEMSSFEEGNAMSYLKVWQRDQTIFGI